HVLDVARRCAPSPALGSLKAAPQGKMAFRFSDMAKIRLSDFYEPQTLKVIYEVFDYLLRRTAADRDAAGPSVDSAMRQRLAEILLTLISEGETDPGLLRRRTLKQFREGQRFS